MKNSITLPVLFCLAAFCAAPDLVAQTDPAGWQPLLLDPIRDPTGTNGHVSLAFNSVGNPVLAYADYDNGRMKVATRTGLTWAFEWVGSSYGGVSLAIDPSDNPSIAWASGMLNFATKSGNRWSTTTVERSNVNANRKPSLAYGVSGPAISYRWNDSSTEGLKFAWRTGSTWTTQFVREFTR